MRLVWLAVNFGPQMQAEREGLRLFRKISLRINSVNLLINDKSNVTFIFLQIIIFRIIPFIVSL